MAPVPKAIRVTKVTSDRRRWRIWLAVLAAMAAWLAIAAALGGLARIDSTCEVCHGTRTYVGLRDATAHESIPCADCHGARGALGLLSDGFAMQRRVLGAVMSRQPSGLAHTPDSSCRTCHATVLEATVRSNGIAVRHVEFVSEPCATCHAGTGHRVNGRLYQSPEMDDCTGCHSVSPRNLANCGLCHVENASPASDDATTAWRATHGKGWESSHGMGELDTCASCHPRDYCVRCHGTLVPHAADWPKTHGTSLTPQERTACETCHEASWCADCHGVEMPHPAGFLPRHGEVATGIGRSACTGCHAPIVCDDCHFRSAHPDIPGVTSAHTGR